MRLNGYLSLVLLAASALTGRPALANVCQAGKLTCATTMPVAGIVSALPTARPREAQWSASPNHVGRRTRPREAVAHSRMHQIAADTALLPSIV